MYALSGSPSINIRQAKRSSKACFTFAMVASVPDGADYSDKGEANGQDDQHDDPAPVGGKPVGKSHR